MFRRYRRRVGQGMFDTMLETLTELVGRARSADMIDRTVVRARHYATGIKEAGPTGAPGRSRGGFSTKLHTRSVARDLILALSLIPEQALQSTGIPATVSNLGGRIDIFWRIGATMLIGSGSTVYIPLLFQ